MDMQKPSPAEPLRLFKPPGVKYQKSLGDERRQSQQAGRSGPQPMAAGQPVAGVPLSRESNRKSNVVKAVGQGPSQARVWGRA